MTRKPLIRRVVTASMSPELKRKVNILRAHLGLKFSATLDRIAGPALDAELRRFGLKPSNGKAAKS